jgi:hypothetical protein
LPGGGEQGVICLNDHERRRPYVGQAAATVVFFNENQFDGNKQACGQIMTQHGDSNRWISDDQSYSLPSDTDFLDPRAVKDSAQAECFL